MIAGLLRRLFRRGPPPPPTTHDFRFRVWGHSVELTRGSFDGTCSVIGWSSTPIHAGDHFILASAREQGARYRVLAVSRPGDPSDFFYARLQFDPRPAGYAQCTRCGAGAERAADLRHRAPCP